HQYRGTARLRAGRGCRRLSAVRSGRPGDRAVSSDSSGMIDLITDRPASRRAWITVALAWVLIAGALTAWLLGTSTGTLREHLKVGQFWSLELCLFLGVICGACVVRGVLRGLDRTDFARMAIVALIGISLTLFV